MPESVVIQAAATNTDIVPGVAQRDCAATRNVGLVMAATDKLVATNMALVSN